jgi:hypothetical protein
MAAILTIYEENHVSCDSMAAILSTGIYEKARFSLAMMVAILTLYEKARVGLAMMAVILTLRE